MVEVGTVKNNSEEKTARSNIWGGGGEIKGDMADFEKRKLGYKRPITFVRKIGIPKQILIEKRKHANTHTAHTQTHTYTHTQTEHTHIHTHRA